MVDLNDPLQRVEFRRAVREAIDEWLDRQFASFGVWSLRGIGAAFLAALAYFWFITHGFNKWPP